MYQNLSGDNTDQLPCYLLPLKSDKGKVLGLIIFCFVHRPNHLKHNKALKAHVFKVPQKDYLKTWHYVYEQYQISNKYLHNSAKLLKMCANVIFCATLKERCFIRD